MENPTPEITTRYESISWVDNREGRTVVKGVLKFDALDTARNIVGVFSCPVQHEIDGDELVKRLKQMGWRILRKRRGYAKITDGENGPVPSIGVYFVDMTRPARKRKTNRPDLTTEHTIDFLTNRPLSRYVLPMDKDARRDALRELGIKISDTPLV